MAHKQFRFEMPADPAVVFDAFHHTQWRHRWDSLVSDTQVEGGAPCPSVGAVTQNTGGGLLRGLAMQTRFISYDRPRVAAAKMVGRSFPFARWAASMRHQPLDGGRSILLYTYSFETFPEPLRWLVEPLVRLVFDYQTRKRFARLSAFLAQHGREVAIWQQEHAKP